MVGASIILALIHNNLIQPGLGVDRASDRVLLVMLIMFRRLMILLHSYRFHLIDREFAPVLSGYGLRLLISILVPRRFVALVKYVHLLLVFNGRM